MDCSDSRVVNRVAQRCRTFGCTFTCSLLHWSMAVQIFAAIPPLLVLAGLLTTLHGELGADTLSGTLRCDFQPNLLWMQACS